MLSTALIATALLPALAQDTLNDPDWHLLRHTYTEASSFLQSNWNKYNENYHPNYVADDNPATAWVEGAPGVGINQEITLPTLTIRKANAVRLRIRNGYQKSEELLVANAAPKRVRIEVADGYQKVASQEVELSRAMGWQTVDLELKPREGDSDVRFDRVRLTVLSVHPGSVYEDTCVSDVQVYVDTDMEVRAAIEAARFQRMLEWVATRNSQAAWFANLPTDYPFASTAFQETERTDEFPGDEDLLLQRTAHQAGELGREGNWYTMTRRAEVNHLPDGLDFKIAASNPIVPADAEEVRTTDPIIDLLTPGGVTFAKTSRKYPGGEPNRHKMTLEQAWVSSASVKWRKEPQPGQRGVPYAVWYESNVGTHERSYSLNTLEHYVEFDEQGRPTSIFQHRVHADYGWISNGTRSWTLHRLHWDEDGRIDRVTTTRHAANFSGDYPEIMSFKNMKEYQAVYVPVPEQVVSEAQ